MLNRFTLATAALLATVPPTSGAQEIETAAITILPIDSGQWRATYTFPDPVTSLRFERDAANHRARVWTVVTPGYRWGHSDDRVVLQLDAGASPQSTITVEFPQFTDPLPKEYELFQPFTDGAVALYTGTSMPRRPDRRTATRFRHCRPFASLRHRAPTR